MEAIKAKFDGRKIVLPHHFKRDKPGNVVVVFEDAEAPADDNRKLWQHAQEETLKKIWNNPEDRIYDEL